MGAPTREMKRVAEQQPGPHGPHRERDRAGLHQHREYQEAIRLKPDYSAAYRGLGRSLERAGRLDDAKTAYATGP